MKYYIISENFVLENNQQWIIDVFAKEFRQYSKLAFVDDLCSADFVWIIGYNKTEVQKLLQLKNKPYVVTTIHHIDWENPNSILEFISLLDPITNHYHTICEKVKKDLETLTQKRIIVSNFWINQNYFYSIPNKSLLRKKWNIPECMYIVGSFQRDTEGKSKCMKPKLSKGPDIFIQIINDIKQNEPNIFILLTGRRRNYMISELERHNIPYKYYEMVTTEELNELYNCLDLYIVSSRVEGGPRSILESGASMVPIISTNVGIVDAILAKESIYDVHNPLSYKKARTNIQYAFKQTQELFIEKHIPIFIENVLKILRE